MKARLDQPRRMLEGVMGAKEGPLAVVALIHSRANFPVVRPFARAGHQFRVLGASQHLLCHGKAECSEDTHRPGVRHGSLRVWKHQM